MGPFLCLVFSLFVSPNKRANSRWAFRNAPAVQFQCDFEITNGAVVVSCLKVGICGGSSRNTPSFHTPFGATLPSFILKPALRPLLLMLEWSSSKGQRKKGGVKGDTKQGEAPAVKPGKNSGRGVLQHHRCGQEQEFRVQG